MRHGGYGPWFSTPGLAPMVYSPPAATARARGREASVADDARPGVRVYSTRGDPCRAPCEAYVARMTVDPGADQCGARAHHGDEPDEREQSDGDVAGREREACDGAAE
jgi:hypothetical protein